MLSLNTMQNENVKENYYKKLGYRLSWYMYGFSVAVLLMFYALPKYIPPLESYFGDPSDWPFDAAVYIIFFPMLLGIFGIWLGEVDSKRTRMIVRPGDDKLKWKYRKSVIAMWIIFSGSIIYFFGVQLLSPAPFLNFLCLTYIVYFPVAATHTQSELYTQSKDDVEK